MGLLTPFLQGWGGESKILEDEGAVRLVSSYLDLKVSLRQPAFLSLAVDSLGLGKAGTNSLRPPVIASAPFRVARPSGSGLRVDYRRPGAGATGDAGWRIEISEHAVRLVSQWSKAEKPEPLVLEFEPRRCHVTLLDNYYALLAVLVRTKAAYSSIFR